MRAIIGRLSVFFYFFLPFMASLSFGKEIDLSGKWRVRLDNDPNEYIMILPGTTDGAGIGVPDTLSPLLKKPQLLHLTRKNRFVGNASYSKEINIPEDMAGKPLRIILERVMWKSCVEIDGNPISDCQESLTSPHIFVFSDGLSAGKHIVTLNIDNSKQYEITTNNLAHAYTDDTQIMWNGVLGEMVVETIPELDFSDIQVYPDINSSSLRIVANILSYLPIDKKINLNWQIDGFKSKDKLSGEYSATLSPGKNKVEFEVFDPILARSLWSEFNPEVLTLRMSSNGTSYTNEVDFGMREVKADGKNIKVNGNPVFLRGTLECCIFPLTGTPPMREEEWEKVFSTAKEWGLNHLRFHSWCPPEAAFRVADRMGFYLQVECPLWSVDILAGEEGENGEMKNYIKGEFDAIVENYGNHPSFCLMTVGNELQKDFDWLNEMTKHMHEADPRHLYSATSFTFEKGHGGHPEIYDDFIVTQWTDNGWVRGQGVFDQEPPSFDKNYSSSVDFLTVPLIEHEIGQYAVYPDLSEIYKYTGVLTPHNFVAIRNDLENKGRLDRSADYLNASGKLASILYKEELERAMKTLGVSGIQMLGLQDFPGQGTALIGLVNAFWESKGIVEPAWFRQFCSPLVPLANFNKAVYEEGETFEAAINLANYSDLSGNFTGSWSLSDDIQVLAEGNLISENLQRGLNPLGEIKAILPSSGKARKLTLCVYSQDDSIRNSWNIWVYPKNDVINYGDVLATTDFKEALNALQNGNKVLFSPSLDIINGTRSKFVPVFWSPVHFPNEAGAMGVLCDPLHPALLQFPNDGHTDWQWWFPVKNSVFMDISDIEDVTPIIEMVDNFTTNRQLGLMFEAKVGNGSLIFSSIDLNSNNMDDPASRQLLKSVLDYMNSEEFAPSGQLKEEKITGLLKFIE